MLLLNLLRGKLHSLSQLNSIGIFCFVELALEMILVTAGPLFKALHL